MNKLILSFIESIIEFDKIMDRIETENEDFFIVPEGAAEPSKIETNLMHLDEISHMLIDALLDHFTIPDGDYEDDFRDSYYSLFPGYELSKASTDVFVAQDILDILIRDGAKEWPKK